MTLDQLHKQRQDYETLVDRMPTGELKAEFDRVPSNWRRDVVRRERGRLYLPGRVLQENDLSPGFIFP